MWHFARRNKPWQHFGPCWPLELQHPHRTGQQRPYGLWCPSVPDRRRTSWRVWSPTACNRSTPPAHLSLRTSLAPAAISALTLSRRPRLMVPPSGSASAGPSPSTLCCSRACLTIRARTLNPSPNLLPSRARSRSIRRWASTRWRILLHCSAKIPASTTLPRLEIGSLSHLAMEAIALKAGAELAHVPYPSSPQAITAVIRNNVQIACLPAIAATPHAATGAVKILAISTARRSPYLPDVPTLKESGIDVEADA